MSQSDQIPVTFLNKTDISERFNMSRVTVNKKLKQLENSGRLFAQTIKQGGRTLYYYDPNDVDVAFETLANRTTVKSNTVLTKNDVNTNVQLQLLRKDLELEQKLRAKDEQTITKLNEQVDKQYDQINKLTALLTDQRQSAAVIEDTDEARDSGPATINEIKVAMVEADKSNDGPAKPKPSLKTKDTETEAEARRARIDQHLQKKEVEPELPAYVKPKGFINWLRGY
jgi:DNA-binding transcriptional regulator GbsR (MarR family)